MGRGAAGDGHIHLHKQVPLLADGRFVGGLHFEAHFLRVLRDVGWLDHDRVRHAEHLGLRGAFKRLQVLQFRHHDAFLALLHGDERDRRRGEISRRRGDLGKGRRIVNTAVSGIHLAHHRVVPFTIGDRAIGIEIEDALVLAFWDRLLAEAAHTGALPDHEHTDRILEAFLALRHHLQILHAVRDERCSRFGDLQ